MLSGGWSAKHLGSTPKYQEDHLEESKRKPVLALSRRFTGHSFEKREAAVTANKGEEQSRVDQGSTGNGSDKKVF